jgi:ABC-2 type transport system permease protein
MLRRDKSTLFWIVLFPFIMTLIFGSIYGRSSSFKVSLAIYSADGNTSIVSSIIKGIESSPIVSRLTYANSTGELRELLNAPPPKTFDVGIIFPEGFTRNVSRGIQSEVLIAYRNTSEPWINTSVFITEGIIDTVSDVMRYRYLEHILAYIPAIYKQYIIAVAEPLKTSEYPVKPSHLVTPARIKAWMALSMIIVEALYIGLNIGATSFHEERKNGLLRPLLSAPLRSWSMLIARLLVSIMMVAVAALSALVAGTILGAEYTTTPGAVLVAAVMTVLATIFTVSMGFIVSGLVKRTESAEAIASAIAFPLMFIGGIMMPSWLLPSFMQKFAHILPISMLADGVRAVAVYGVSPIEAIREYMPPQIIAITLAFILIGIFMYRKMLEKSIEEPA